jgi:hypothetical protein
MPLLMTELPSAPLPDELTLDVRGGEARLIRARQGQLLSVETPEGGQIAELFAYTTVSSREFLSPHHTRVFGGTFLLRMATRMVTNRRRPIFVVSRDSHRRHDLLSPASDACLGAVADALAGAGLRPMKIPDPVNLFMNTELRSDGGIRPGSCLARPGDRITLRVLMDADVVVAACQAARSAAPPTMLRVRLTNFVEDLPEDLPIRA